MASSPIELQKIYERQSLGLINQLQAVIDAQLTEEYARMREDGYVKSFMLDDLTMVQCRGYEDKNKIDVGQDIVHALRDIYLEQGWVVTRGVHITSLAISLPLPTDPAEKLFIENSIKFVKDNNLERGDLVKVTRKADNYENGWGDRWWGVDMNDLVGQTLEVVEACQGCNGIKLAIGQNSFGYFPHFVLEFVKTRAEAQAEAEIEED